MQLQRAFPAVLVLAGTVAALTFAPAARAGFQLRVSNGSTSVTLTDNGPGDASSVPGQIVYASNVGAFVIDATVAASNVGSLTISSLNVWTYRPGTLTVSLTDTDFTAPPGSGGSGLLLTSKISTTSGPSTPGISFQFQSYADANNQAFATTGATPGAQGPFTTAVSGNNKSTSFSWNGKYSLTSVATINFGGQGGFLGLSGATDVSAPSGVLTPAPGGLTLALSGLPLLAGALWFWRRKQQLA
jgi:hypothetical protein